MKANEAPEKIYVSRHSGLHSYEKNNEDDIEYTSTDAFIENAVRWLNCRLYDRVEVVNFGSTLESIIPKKEFVIEFRKYMKGEYKV